MLNLLSITLAGRPFTQAGAPVRLPTPRDGALDTPQDDSAIELALEVLGTFNFKGIFQVQPTHNRSGISSGINGGGGAGEPHG